MKCPTCFNNSPDEAQFCGSCGASLATSTDSGARPVVGELPTITMISFPNAVRRGFNLYSDFTGRATRAECWWWILFIVISNFALGILELIPGIPGILGLCFSLATIIPSLAVGTRRLHDINRTGWWLILNVVPIIGWIPLVVWAIFRGDEGPNQYGPDPRRAID